jgi:hypothetical protein
VHTFYTLLVKEGRSVCFSTTRRLLQVILGGLFVLGCVTVRGQGQDDEPENEIGFNFRVRNEFSFDDNILNLRDSNLESRIWELAPDANFTFQRGGTLVIADANLIHRNYLDSQIDTYTSRVTSLNLQQWIRESLRLRFGALRNNNFESRGSGANEGQNALNITGPTPLDTTQYSLGVQLGREQSRIRLNANFLDSATDRQSPIIINDSTDYSERTSSFSANYKFRRRTDLVAEYRTRKFFYPNLFNNADGSVFSRNSTETIVIVGADLAATARTGGKARIGRIKREFAWKTALWDGAEQIPEGQVTAVAVGNPDALPFENSSDLYWELMAIWNIKSYSRLEVSTQSSTQEALLVGNYIRNRNTTLRWTHLWTEQLQSIIEYTFGTDLYKGTDRLDERTVYNLRLEYNLDDWLRLGLGLRNQSLDSPFETVGYDKNIFYIYATYSNGY